MILALKASVKLILVPTLLIVLTQPARLDSKIRTLLHAMPIKNCPFRCRLRLPCLPHQEVPFHHRPTLHSGQL